MNPEEVQRLRKDNYKVWFETNADRQALLRVLKRCITPVTKNVRDIRLADKNTYCTVGEKCNASTLKNGDKADFKIIKEDHVHAVCWPCLEASIDNWIQEMQETMKYHLDRYSVAEEL